MWNDLSDVFLSVKSRNCDYSMLPLVSFFFLEEYTKLSKVKLHLDRRTKVLRLESSVFLAVPHGMQDLSSLTRDRTRARCIVSVES